MARYMTWVLTLALACVPAVASAHKEPQTRPDGGQRGVKETRNGKPQSASDAPNDRERLKWWLYDRAELGITDQQSRAINEIFESTVPRLRETRHELERAEEELSRTIKEHKADLATISLLVDRVESARSQHTKLRVLMLYRMDQLLSPEQRTKLEALRARREAERGRDRQPPSGHRKP